MGGFEGCKNADRLSGDARNALSSLWLSRKHWRLDTIGALCDVFAKQLSEQGPSGKPSKSGDGKDR
jgi:prenyltransferase beta subunit